MLKQNGSDCLFHPSFFIRIIFVVVIFPIQNKAAHQFNTDRVTDERLLSRSFELKAFMLNLPAHIPLLTNVQLSKGKLPERYRSNKTSVCAVLCCTIRNLYKYVM